MSEIDWSKAPEGATHWDSRGNCCSVGFMKPGLRVGEWEYFGVGGHWVLYGQVDRALAAAMIKRPTDTSWSGEGLPPVGTVCEYKRVHEWQKVEVFAVKPNYNGSHTALFTYENGAWCGCADPSCFRPIRTPEQIAAEEREKAIMQITADSMGRCDYYGAAYLHEAGYRKVTP